MKERQCQPSLWLQLREREKKTACNTSRTPVTSPCCCVCGRTRARDTTFATSWSRRMIHYSNGSESTLFLRGGLFSPLFFFLKRKSQKETGWNSNERTRHKTSWASNEIWLDEFIFRRTEWETEKVLWPGISNWNAPRHYPSNNNNTNNNSCVLYARWEIKVWREIFLGSNGREEQKNKTKQNKKKTCLN